MFGFGTKKNNKTNKQKKPKNPEKGKKELQASCAGGKQKKSNDQGLAGDALRAQALVNARKAREHIGEDTIRKIVEAMAKKENNPMEKAKRKLENVDSDRIADEILSMLNDK